MSEISNNGYLSFTVYSLKSCTILFFLSFFLTKNISAICSNFDSQINSLSVSEWTSLLFFFLLWTRNKFSLFLVWTFLSTLLYGFIFSLLAFFYLSSFQKLWFTSRIILEPTSLLSPLILLFFLLYPKFPTFLLLSLFLLSSFFDFFFFIFLFFLFFLSVFVILIFLA